MAASSLAIRPFTRSASGTAGSRRLCDAAGNLVRYELVTGGQAVLSQDYEIGDFNEVVPICTYDSAGRTDGVGR